MWRFWTFGWVTLARFTIYVISERMFCTFRLWTLLPERWRYMFKTRICGIFCSGLLRTPTRPNAIVQIWKYDVLEFPLPVCIRAQSHKDPWTRCANGHIALIGCRMIFHLSQIQGTECSIGLEPRNIKSYTDALQLGHIIKNKEFPFCSGVSRAILLIPS